MYQKTARRLAREINAKDPSALAVATTQDAQAGKWEKTNVWIVTTVNGRTYYDPPESSARA